ncbi:PREDICTED: phospholipase ABHD3 [Myotis davidii]|uniref:phospholipase ABHD3 n=1 Tax=Myotis davidii TaxID=225400 RepID=UPI0007673842|nr:PREDICTED: phospholipase ABHD3 [Myotis davidii]
MDKDVRLPRHSSTHCFSNATLPVVIFHCDNPTACSFSFGDDGGSIQGFNETPLKARGACELLAAGSQSSGEQRSRDARPVTVYAWQKLSLLWIRHGAVFPPQKPQLVTGAESFSRFLQDHCPVVTETYYPTVWCWESRGQTLLRPFITSKPPVRYRNEFIKTADGGQILLDWFDNDNSKSYMDASTRPTILLLPGLTGTSKESYILHMIHLSEELGYRCVVFNNRGMAGENLLTPRTYCCANTEDLETVIHHVHSLYPSAPFLAAGVSMGGMLLLNYLGKIGTKTPLKAAATFSVGWNTFACSESLEKPLNWLLFNYYLTTCLQSSVNKHRHMFVKQIDMDHVMKAKSIREFDKRFTSVMFGYQTIDDYYTDASPNRRLKSVGIPVLCLNSVDDVFSPSHAIPIETAKQNPNVALVLTSYGGHIGFLEGIWPRQSTYMDRVFKQFVQAMVEHGHELSNM